MKEIIICSYVGLFWLSKDYSSITDVNGLKEFTESDVKSGVLIQPIGGHYLYNFPRDVPRGRVELHEGKLKIYLGEDFPKEKYNSLKDRVIESF